MLVLAFTSFVYVPNLGILTREDALGVGFMQSLFVPICWNEMYVLYVGKTIMLGSQAGPGRTAGSHVRR